MKNDTVYIETIKSGVKEITNFEGKTSEAIEFMKNFERKFKDDLMKEKGLNWKKFEKLYNRNDDTDYKNSINRTYVKCLDWSMFILWTIG